MNNYQSKYTGEQIENRLSGYSNPNLLINSNFCNAINQRGVTSSGIITASNYIIDRWYTYTKGSNATYNIDANGLTFSQPEGTSEAPSFIYRFSEEDKNLLKGKTVTLQVNFTSIESTNIQMIFETDDIDGNYLNLRGATNTAGVFIKTFTFPEDIPGGDIMRFKLYCNMSSNSNFTVSYIKLELGDLATPYIPKKYIEELHDCQYYFYCLNPLRKNITFAIGQPSINNVVYIPINLPTPMRISPTVSAINISDLKIRYINEDGTINDFLITSLLPEHQRYSGNLFRLRVEVSPNITSIPLSMWLYTPNGTGDIFFDAEI